MLQIDDGLNGEFRTLYGNSSDSLLTSYTAYNLVKGRYYGFRYSAKNIYGWSLLWSPITFIRVSQIPVQPPAPTLIASSDVSITMQLYPCPDNGGAPILGYELWKDDGTVGGQFSLVSTYIYASFAMTHTVDTTNDPYVSGSIGI